VPTATPGRAGSSSDGQARLAASVEIARVYGLAKQDGHYVLVDRLWPRGVARATAPFDEWLKDVSPSTELRKWYGHRPERFEEFARRYGQELEKAPGRDALDELRRQARAGRLVLVTATKDLQHSEAAVLQLLLRAT
jgi:uncharacterized protein YeaO (DUF488 family)